MSNINELRAELSRLERINQELNAELWGDPETVSINATQSLVNFQKLYDCKRWTRENVRSTMPHAKILDGV